RLTRRSGYRVELGRPCSKRTSARPSLPKVFGGLAMLLRSLALSIGNPGSNDASAPPQLGTDLFTEPA
ncbi:hypothetical protein U1Q18_014958, partial [Sarracenia purpurea var. burkii]